MPRPPRCAQPHPRPQPRKNASDDPPASRHRPPTHPRRESNHKYRSGSVSHRANMQDSSHREIQKETPRSRAPHARPARARSANHRSQMARRSLSHRASHSRGNGCLRKMPSHTCSSACPNIPRWHAKAMAHHAASKRPATHQSPRHDPSARECKQPHQFPECPHARPACEGQARNPPTPSCRPHAPRPMTSVGDCADPPKCKPRSHNRSPVPPRMFPCQEM